MVALVVGDDLLDGIKEDLVSVLVLGVGSLVLDVHLSDLQVSEFSSAVEDVPVFDVEEIVGEDDEDQNGKEE